MLYALQTYCSFYRWRNLASKRDILSIFQHYGALLSYISVSEGVKYLSGLTPRCHRERSTLQVKPELNLAQVQCWEGHRTCHFFITQKVSSTVQAKRKGSFQKDDFTIQIIYMCDSYSLLLTLLKLMQIYIHTFFVT